MNNTKPKPKASGTPGDFLFVPSRLWIETLAVGDFAPDHAGRMKRVVEISYRGENVNGKAYVGVYTENGPGSRVSQSYTEDRLDRNVATSGKFKSHELDAIEKEYIARREKIKELKRLADERFDDHIAGREIDPESYERTRAIVRELTEGK